MVNISIFIFEFVILFILSRILIKHFSQFLMRVARSRGGAMKLFHILLLPGVVVHELAHLIVAEVMLVRTGGLSFSLEPQGDKMVLGSVGIEQTDPIRRAIIGFAPVFVGILFISFVVFYFLSDSAPISFPFNYLLVFFVVFEVGNTMFSSSKDLEGSAQLLIFFTIIGITAYFFGVRIPEFIISFFESPSFIEAVNRGIRVLLFPIIIDLLLIILIKSSYRRG